MTFSTGKHGVASMVAAAVALAIAASARTAEPDKAPEPRDTTLEEVIVTGTRATGVALSESATPIQVVSGEALATSGKADLIGTLAQIVPSFQAQSFGGDMSNQTLQAKLRGLSPNHALVLIDGKRRHTTANLAVATGAFQGGAGVDLNFIPVGAIDHVEVLTDGAAATYGTDAIAGVINIITKKDATGGNLSVRSGAYYDQGGQSLGASGNIGFEPAAGAYLNLSVEARSKDATDRGGPDYRVFNPSASVNPPAVSSNTPYIQDYPYINHIFGEAANSAQLAALSAGYKFGDGTDLYSLFTWGHKSATSLENVRLPGQISVLYGTQRVYPYPYGFNPKESSDERDYSGTLGLAGEAAGWKWDLSTIYGKDEVNVYTLDSINSSLYQAQVTRAYAAGAALPLVFQQDFRDGVLEASQWTTGLDISRDLETAIPVTVAFGLEYRKDTYEIVAGEPSSYYGSPGAQSFPGYQPWAAGHHSRDNKAIYANVIVKPLEPWTIDVAGRHEDYSDFGTTTIGKFTTRYDITDAFAVRGTYSTGFRAPTLAEEFYSAGNVSPTSTFLQLPPNSPGAIAILGHGLEPEKSKSISAGLVFKANGFLATLDGFQIKLKNRIAGSSSIYGWYLSGGLGQNGVAGAGLVSQAALDIAQAYGVVDPNALLDPNGSVGFNLFANGIDTTTSGVDLVLSYRSAFDFGSVDWTFSGTRVKNKVTSFAPLPQVFYSPPRNSALFDSSKEADLEDATPDFVLNLGALAKFGDISVNLREVLYGSSQVLTRTGSPVQDYITKLGAQPITNLDLGYQATEHLNFTLGAQNVFNKYPTKINGSLLAYYRSAYSNGTVSQYPSISPYGFSGGFYYGKVTYRF